MPLNFFVNGYRRERASNNNNYTKNVNLVEYWEQLTNKLEKLEEEFITRLNQDLVMLNVQKNDDEKNELKSSRWQEILQSKEEIQHQLDPNYDPADHWASIETDIRRGK